VLCHSLNLGLSGFVHASSGTRAVRQHQRSGCAEFDAAQWQARFAIH